MVKSYPSRLALRSYLQLLGLICFASLLLGACGGPASASDLLPAAVPGLATAETIPPGEPSSPVGTPLPAAPVIPTLTPSPTASPVPTASPTPLECWKKAGRTDQGVFRSKWLPLPMEYRIHLPPCYDEQAESRYPVLYMVHGMNYNEDQWERLGAGELADRLASAGELPPFIIVMPRDRNWNQPSEDNFGQVLVDEFLPWVDKNYRTLPDRQHRAIGGLSRGAAWAVHLGLSRWDLFSALGAHSLPVFHEDTTYLQGWLDKIPAESQPRIFLDIGDRDRPEILSSAKWFESLLNQRGYPHEWYLFPGYHEEAYWHAHLEQYLRWYAAQW